MLWVSTCQEDRSHLSANSNGYLKSVDQLFSAKVVDRLAKVLVCKTGVIPQAGNRVRNVYFPRDSDTFTSVDTG